jgi:competence protein ComFB
MKNLLEGAVKEVYDELRTRGGPQGAANFCGCPQCEEDVLAFALNHLRPRYAGGTREGVAVTSVDLQRDQTRAQLMVAVLDAMRRVASNPRHPVGEAKRGGRVT